MNAPMYQLLDSGEGEKLERFGDIVLVRPSPQAQWRRRLDASQWRSADARFLRDSSGGGQWKTRTPLPESWVCQVGEQHFDIRPTNFGHLGVFTEQREFWQWIRTESARARRDAPPAVLNLFAYTGGSSIAAARGGASVTHCDASKGIVQWASETAAHNAPYEGSIRWIVDDALKFLRREARRDRRYQGVILDPPSFGRGPKGEVFKLEESILPLLDACCEVLADDAQFVLLSAHTPGLGSVALSNLLADGIATRFDASRRSAVHQGEMVIYGDAEVAPLPSGQWASWSVDGNAPATEART